MSDSKWVKGLQSRLLELPEGLLVAALYAAACWSAWHVSLDQFFLPAGIRVAALLVCRREMWPYLLLGEYVYLGCLRVPMIAKHGLDWVLISSSYQFPFAALVVHLHRRAISSHRDTWLITVAAAISVSIGVGNLALVHMLSDAPPAGGFMTVASRVVLGHYMAILTTAPLALLWMKRRGIDWAAWRGATTTYAGLSLLACGAVSVVLPETSDSAKVILQLLMAIPVVVLTCIHGWWGAAVGLPLMSILVRINTPVTGLPESFDLESFKVQLLTALAGTTLLVLGSRITHYYRQYLFQAKAQRQAIANTRASHCTGERELRNRVADLRRIGDGLDAALSETIDWLRVRGQHDVATSVLNVATVHSRKFREQANMVYPTTMEHVGLYLALQVGGIGDAWEETDRLVQPYLLGDPCRLSLDLQLTTYRAMIEAVSLLLEHEPGQLKIRGKCGSYQSSKGILVTVGTLDTRHRLSRSTATMAVGRLSGRTQAYGGTVECHRNRIRMFFKE
ncbi:MASE1 domain-containing protein [Stenotrophomonas oahuensis]|uniref:MASE1 domain-containing protein n=1 Tax=Stenotrophomonas oahuensis TaxID=3003271 RepID=A0ABY9YW13_9GAMM|nr:MASE1 domain-containing protein [Stenotrophomonas sp. A5586]WNH54374.1 MASE1 domain-containing protein [Stenotrophomonas sp. A5586]